MFNNGRLDNVCQGEDHHRIHPNVIVEFQCLLGIFRLIEVLHFSTTGEWERNKGAGEQRRAIANDTFGSVAEFAGVR